LIGEEPEAEATGSIGAEPATGAEPTEAIGPGVPRVATMVEAEELRQVAAAIVLAAAPRSHGMVVVQLPGPMALWRAPEPLAMVPQDLGVLRPTWIMLR